MPLYTYIQEVFSSNIVWQQAIRPQPNFSKPYLFTYEYHLMLYMCSWNSMI